MWLIFVNMYDVALLAVHCLERCSWYPLLASSRRDIFTFCLIYLAEVVLGIWHTEEDPGSRCRGKGDNHLTIIQNSFYETVAADLNILDLGKIN